MEKDDEITVSQASGCLGLAGVLLGLLIGCIALGMFLGAAYGLAAAAAVVMLAGCFFYAAAIAAKKKEKRDGE